ncbi:MAG: glycyl-radical enzyme activating protein [Oscillospiraceae bacterium]|nr:glycyl-radical enzyme activating protein [Oscillospiraceae bacterium]
MTTPLISNLQRFSVDDGPGIRTTVFFKGCNLRCLWCHNPECITSAASLQFLDDVCTKCARCAAVCPNGVYEITEAGEHLLHRERCSGCGNCAQDCLSGALKVLGAPEEAEKLVSKLLRDKRYFDTSGGGVTLSGGDPMLFPDYIVPVLKKLGEAGVHRAVDTAGCVPWGHFERVLPHTDLFLYDVKAYSAALHKKLTGVDNGLILENLRRLSATGAAFFVRVPVIPGCNDDLQELSAVACFLEELPTPPELTQLLPYHSYGAGKYAALGMEDPLPNLQPPDGAWMEQALELFVSKGLNASIS